jgi:hypothetical protein
VSETSEQIETHIRDTRENLSANLHELEQKVKSATDWRQHYHKSTGTFLAVALGGGLLLALATNGRKSRALPAPNVHADVPARRRGTAPLEDSIDVIKGALIGLAATHAKNALSQLLPGFEAQLKEREKPPPPPAADLHIQSSGNGASAEGASRQ